MRVNIIKSLSNKVEQIEIKAGRPAFEIFKDINFQNAVLIVNGKKQPADYIIKNNDIVTLRILPTDLTETPWWVATFFIPFGFIIQPVELAIKARQQSEEAERELEKIKKLTNNTTVDNRPFLRGASNAIATGKSQPYYCGKNLNTPYLFSNPFYKLSGANGENQEVYNIFECGFKDIVISQISMGDTVIKEFDDETPQNGTYTINDGLFANGIVEIKQNGELFSSLPELNYKTVSNVINKEVAKQPKVSAGETEHLIFSLDPNALNVEIAIKFPYGLYAYNDNNDRVETQVEIIPEYSIDGGKNFIQFSFNSGNIFRNNATKELRYVARCNFNLNTYVSLINNHQKNIIVRVRSNGADDQKIKNDCYLFYYQSQIYDPEKSSMPAGVLDDGGVTGLTPCLNVENRERGYSCIMGLKLKSTKNNEKKMSQINIVATSTARIWDGSEWSSEKYPTRNPAAIALEIMTTAIHPASQYSDDEIDLLAWGALYEYCENENIKFDYIITQNQKKNDTLKKICDVCNAAIYKDIYGRISVSIDTYNNNVLAVYNPNNIISITNKKSFSRRVDALRIKYIDSNNDTYKENTYTVTRTENGQPVPITEDSIIKDITATGITTYEQIVKYGRRLMAVDELRQITTTIKIGMEGVYYTPFSRILIQDPSLNSDAQDAIIDDVQYFGGILKKIILKNNVVFDSDKQYGIIVNSTDEYGAHPIPLKVEGVGTTKELTVTTIYSVSEDNQPRKNNNIAFGELDENGEFTHIAHDYIITRISRSDNGYTLDLQEYNESIYDSGTIPAYKPIINNTPTPEAGEVPIDAITSEQLESRIDGANGDAVQAAVDTISKGYRFTNVYNIRPIEQTLEEIIAKLDDDQRNTSASISISEDEILLQVSDMERELVGLIDVQAGAVTALVEGGGTVGQLSLSLQLPAVITEETRAKLITASSAAAVNAVYGLIEKTTMYGIKPAASAAQIKALWDAAVSAGFLASQIELQADQIYIDGETIINNARKIKAELIDVENLLAKEITVKDKGVIKSSNYNGTIDSNGNITQYGNAGWAVDHAGKSDFVNINATGGNFENVTVSGKFNVTGGLKTRSIQSLGFSAPPEIFYNELIEEEHNVNENYLCIGKFHQNGENREGDIHCQTIRYNSDRSIDIYGTLNNEVYRGYHVIHLLDNSATIDSLEGRLPYPEPISFIGAWFLSF